VETGAQDHNLLISNGLDLKIELVHAFWANQWDKDENSYHDVPLGFRTRTRPAEILNLSSIATHLIYWNLRLIPDQAFGTTWRLDCRRTSLLLELNSVNRKCNGLGEGFKTA